MSRRGLPITLLVLILSTAPSCFAEQSALAGTPSSAPSSNPAGVADSTIDYRPPVVLAPTPFGLVPYSPPLIVLAPGGFFPPPPPVPPLRPFAGYPAPLGPAPLGLLPRAEPPIRPVPAPGAWPRQRPRARRGDPRRADALVTAGTRQFRAGSLEAAVTRFEAALRLDPDSAPARIGLAQVAIARGDYSEAAERYREAQTADPDWLDAPEDVQGMYGEPAAFAAQIARLESHLQTHPDDRDAWLVLGAQWFFTGRAPQAADIFLRLDDPRRGADPTLAAFLRAVGGRQ